MINPNKTHNVNGKIVSIEQFTSFRVIKIETKHGIFDYNEFGAKNDSLVEGTRTNVTIAYSINLNGYYVRYINSSLKVA